MVAYCSQISFLLCNLTLKQNEFVCNTNCTVLPFEARNDAEEPSEFSKMAASLIPQYDGIMFGDYGKS